MSTTIIIVLSALALLGVIAVLLSPRFSPRLYGRVFLHPQPYDDKSYADRIVCGIAAEDVYIEVARGVTLHAWYFAYPGATDAVLFSHGNGGNVGGWKPCAKRALESGLSALVYDYRGYGLSTGTPSLPGICADGIAAFDYLKSRGFRERDITLYGFSMGAAVSCQIIKLRSCAGVVIEGGFANFRQLACELVGYARFIPKSLFFKPLDNAEVLNRVPVPALIIHGGKDQLIGAHHAQQLYKAASGDAKLIVLPESGHMQYQNKEEQRTLIEGVKNFLAKVSAR